MEILSDIPFFLPKSSDQHLSVLRLRSIFMESIGAVLTKIYSTLYIEKFKSPKNGVFCKRL